MKKALVNLHIAVFLAGFTGVLGRLISVNEVMLVWYRLLLTVVGLVILIMFKHSLPRLSLKRVLPIFGVGTVVAMHWVTFYGSIKYANVSIALVCFSTLGFFSALLEPLLFRKSWSRAELALGLLAILGVYLIFQFDARYTAGIIFGLLSALLAAVFTIFNKRLLDHHEPETVTFYELTGGFLALTLILPLYLRAFNLSLALPRGLDWLWLLLLSWICTVLAFYLSTSALKQVSSFTVNLSYNLEPLYGIGLAFIIYKENKDLGISFYLGFLLIVLAVALQMGRLYRKRM
ncbi:MAG: DMT family transporter [Chitinophagaceae bacterium]